MDSFMPNARRNVRAHRDTVGLLTKGNRRNTELDLNRPTRSADHCAVCGGSFEPRVYWKGSEWVNGRTRSEKRPNRCVKCESRSSGTVAGATEHRSVILSVFEWADRARRIAPQDTKSFWRSVPHKLRGDVHAVTDLDYLSEIARRAGIDEYAGTKPDEIVFGLLGARVAVVFDESGRLIKAQTSDARTGYRGRSTVIGRNRAAKVADFMNSIRG
ncbi:hypothetical protein [Nocardia puris]|uniref:hypothetical protein n=1 Tax=Nocardia puris TaxID=208602 RepID=UPI0011BF8166|nr:hypothetical protein [Nocardia puris]